MVVNLSIRFAKDRRHRHGGGGGSDESSIRVPGCGNQGHGTRIGLHDPQILSSTIKRSGAKGSLNKSKAGSDLAPALEAILAGQTYFH